MSTDHLVIHHVLMTMIRTNI